MTLRDLTALQRRDYDEEDSGWLILTRETVRKLDKIEVVRKLDWVELKHAIGGIPSPWIECYETARQTCTASC